MQRPDARHQLRGRVVARLVLGVSLVLAPGCPDESSPQDQAKPSPEPAATHEFRAKTHVAAFERLLPLTRRALALADPIVESVLSQTVLNPMPFTVGGRAALRKAVDAAWIEAADIRPEFLPAQSALLLRVARFSLSRLRDEQQRRPSTRVDPAVGLRATAALLDEVGFRGPQCPGCDEALAAAGPELDAAIADLGATNPARARAAASDCDALRERLGAWRRAQPKPDATPGAAVLDAALERAREHLLAVAAAIAQATIASPKRDEVRVARAPGDVVRIADRLGADELRRWLDVHESETRDAKTLFEALMPAALQLGALATPPASPEATVDEAREIDAARCEAAWSVLASYAKTQPAVVAQFDCDRDRLRIGSHASDADLLRALVRAGIVEPTRRASRAATEPMLARVAGEIAPAAHGHSLSLAVLSGAKQVAARARAAAAAQADVCTALVGLWVHGELGDDAALRERLAAPCNGIDIAPLIDAVIARPEPAFAGLGLSLLAMGPADAVALERSWWLPYGLVIPAARPEEALPEVPVAVRSEELRADTGTPDEATPPAEAPPAEAPR